MLLVENNNLKEKIHDNNDEINRLAKEIKQYQSKLEDEVKTKEKLEKSQNDVKWLEAQFKTKENEVEEQRKTIQNLQRAISYHLEEYEQIVRIKEKEQSDEKMLIQTLTNQAIEMKSKMKEATELEEQLLAMRKDYEIA